MGVALRPKNAGQLFVGGKVWVFRDALHVDLALRLARKDRLTVLRQAATVCSLIGGGSRYRSREGDRDDGEDRER
jgi:hypothetical protein